MIKTRTLAHAALANRIQLWLTHYPEKLLDVQDFLFLALHDEIFINRANFDEKEILNGRFANVYKKMRDSGKLQLFDCKLESQYLIERVREIRGKKNFIDLDNTFENDICSLSNNLSIPFSFFREDFYHRTGNRDGLNFFSNWSRAFILYAQFIENSKESGLVDPQEYQDFFLSFGLILDLPNLKSNNTPKIIEERKQELEPAYNMMGNEYKSEIDFSNFVCVGLVHDINVDCSPADFFDYVKDLNFGTFHDNYIQLQKAIDSREELTLYENAMINHNQQSLIGNWIVKSTNFGVFKNRVLSETPPLHGRHNQSLPCNRRILDNSQWLFTEHFFGTTLSSILAGNPL
jgi:hypothetical protein